MLKRCAGVCAVLILLLAGVVRADASLPEDPAIVRGRFDNGLSYLIRSHKVPPGRVAAYLHVKAGALDETPEQNGLAHFLEHMAFHGSTHFEPGTLLPYLNSLGMAFGVHSNAHTRPRETVYKLYMPDNKPETLETALRIFADYANGLLIDEARVEAERGVVLAEMRAREGAQMRIRRKLMAALYPEAKLTKHDTIGDPQVVAAATREPLVAYWNAHYRPEAMTLIVVGDVEPEAVIEVAGRRLGTFAARAPRGEPGRAGLAPYIGSAARGVVLTDPELVRGQVTLSRLAPPRPPVRDESQFLVEEIEDMAIWLLNRRLSNRVREGTAVYQAAGVGASDLERDATSIELTATSRPEEWEKALEDMVLQVTTAAEHGFTPEEIEQARRTWISAAADAVKTVETADARAFLDTYSDAVGNDELILSPAQRLELLERLLPGVGDEQLRAAIRNLFVDQHYVTLLIVPEPKEGQTLPAEEQVMAATAAAWARRPAGATTRSATLAELPDPPEPGSVRSKAVDPDLEITTIEFDNGVVMHHRYSDYKKNMVFVQMTLPGGRLQETAQNRGISAAASTIFARPATSRLSSTQIRDLLTGRSVSMGGVIGMDAMTVQVAATPDDLELGLRVTHALLTDGRLEAPAFDQWVRATLEQIEAARTNPSAALSRAVSETVMGGDERFVELTEEDVRRQDRLAAEQWFHRIAASAAVEVAIVGDLPLEQATALVARYVGSLPPRQEGFDALDGLRSIERPAGPYERRVTFPGVAPKAVAAAGFLGCEHRDVADRRTLNLAARVLTERMTQRLRQEEQLVYSIQCSSSPAVALPGTGTFSAGAATDPQHATRLTDEIIEMMQQFAADGPTEAELAAAKLQTIKSLEASTREPSYWMRQLAELHYRKRSLDDLKEMTAAYEAIDAETVRDTVRRYLTDERTIRITAIPEQAEQPAQEQPAAEPVAQ